MRRINSTRWMTVGLMAVSAVGARADQSAEYADYYAGRAAYNQGDCASAAEHLKAFLRDHPDVREQHLGFYLDVQQAISDCTGTGRVTGVGNESKRPDLLPATTPMEE